MEHVYSVFHPNPAVNRKISEWLSDRRCLSCLSSRNLLAFTTFADLKLSDTKTLAVHVYLIDLNLPHEPSLITRHDEDISSIEWDISGTKLLIADTFGYLEIWSMKDNLISDWQKAFSFSCFIGEKILSSIWFHNGLKTMINPEKKDSIVSYTEKFICSKFAASVRQFGVKPANGCLALSSSGLLWCVAFLSDGSLVTGSKLLSQVRSKLKVVDICYAKNGDFLVVTSNGSIDSSINCFRVTVKLNSTSLNCEKNKCIIVCQPFCSFYLNCSTNSIDDFKYVNNLKWVLKEAAEAVVVGSSGPMGSCVELWELREKPVVLHKSFQINGNDYGNSTNQPKTFVWQYHASARYHQTVVTIATPRLSLSDINPPHSYIMIAYKDNMIKCYNREGLKPAFQYMLNSSSLKTSITSKFSGTVKLASSPCVNNIVDMQFSWSGCCLVAMDTTSQLFVFRIPPILDSKNSFSSLFLTTMLEYCLVTGNDWWDILICTRPNIIESVCDTFTESFMQKQNPEVKQKWLNRFLTMKASLYRLLNSGNSGNTGQVKSGDCYTLIILNAIANLAKSLLRPKFNQEKEGPAENLSNIIQTKANEPQYLNVDKVLLCLEHKDFFVETTILQSLQHLNQWVGNLALYLLASLPQQCHNHCRFPGGGLIFDSKSVNIIRELLVIIRTWGLVKESCLPVFTQLTSDVDPLGLIFRLLTKIASLCSLGNEPDEAFLDECCSLPNQVLVPQLDLTLKAIGVTSPALFINLLPLHFQYYTDAPFLKYSIKKYNIDGAVLFNTGQKVDSIRHITIGGNLAENNNIRTCTRCCAVSLIQPYFKSPSTRAWDQRWCTNCICGGHWRSTSSQRAQ